MAEMVSLEGMDVMEHLVLKDLQDLKVNLVNYLDFEGQGELKEKREMWEHRDLQDQLMGLAPLTSDGETAPAQTLLEQR